jgi:hypothetical protein
MNGFKITIDPDESNAIPRRIVEVTDQDETILAEFIDLDAARRPQ